MELKALGRVCGRVPESIDWKDGLWELKNLVGVCGNVLGSSGSERKLAKEKKNSGVI